jgi:hypothetical protein
MIQTEYYMFTKENPCERIKDYAKKLSLAKKWKIAPHIRRAEALVRKSQKFRDIICDEENQYNHIVGLMFSAYFGEKIDKYKYTAVPRDISFDFLGYIKNHPISDDDKYMKKVTTLILSHSDQIDAFVKAFLGIRLAQSELDKLQSN